LRILCQERHVVNVGRGGDQQVESSATRIPAAIHYGGRHPSPLPRNRGVERQGVEGRLDRAEPL
jgi:hypothetical protein